MTQAKTHFMTPDLEPTCGLTRIQNPILTHILEWVTCKLCLTIIERERRFGKLWTAQIN